MRRVGKGVLRAAAVTAMAAGVSSSAAVAQAGEPLPTRAERLFTPGRNATSEDSADALVLNPANLGFMPAAEARWDFVRCPDDAHKVACGHAWELATPLLWGLATGLRVDFIQPPWGGAGVGVPFPYRGYDYTWVTWGVGWQLGPALGFGMSLQRSYSTNAYTNGLWGITAGLTIRPNSHFGLAAVAHDFNGPSTENLPPNNLPVLDRSYVLSAAVRPTGRRAFEIALDMKYLEGSAQWLPRLSAGADIPYVGRLRGDVEVAHLPSDVRRGVVGTASLELAFDGVTAGGGAAFGNGLGSSSTVAEFGTISISGYRETASIPKPKKAVFIRLESTPGTRGHVALLEKLWRIAKDPEIAGVALVLRAEPAASLARAEELSDALRVLRAYGKKTLCSLEDNGGRSLYVCANADRTVVNPAGGVRYAGLRAQYIYLAGLLSKIGVKAEFVRIGAHKSAPEQFMNEQASETAREDHIDMLRETEAVFVKNLSQGRKLTPAQVRAATARGPFVASEAREAGFVDGYAFDDELDRAMSDVIGHRIGFSKYQEETRMPEVFAPRPSIAVLYVDGDIVDGRSQHIPIVDSKLVGSYSIVEQIKALRDDPGTRAVILRINSPGGSSMASDVMWRELVLLGQRKPLIVSMDSVAASGGYYIASAAKTIYALPLTVTGSIGIFYGKADLSGLLHTIGVNVETYRSSPRADAESLFRGFTPEERVELQHKVQQFYDVFLARVSAGRHMTKAQVDAVGQGRVWTGQEALDRHLVDHMGGLRQALEQARAETGLGEDAPIEEYPAPESSLLDTALKLAGVGHASGIEDVLPVAIKDVARAVAPMAVYTGDTPLARMEWVPVEE